MQNETVARIRRKAPTLAIVAALLAMVILTAVNVYISNQFSEDLAGLGFQDNAPNTTAVVVASATDSDLGEPSVYFMSNQSIQSTVHYGVVEPTIQTLNVHYGALTIYLSNFNVTPSGFLDPDKLNETQISFADQNESHTYVLAPGMNRASPQLRIKAQVFPNTLAFPSKDQTVRFSLGFLTLDAEFVDFDTQNSYSRSFSTEIFISLELPQ